MKGKQRKWQLWRMFGYVILIIIKFRELLLWISMIILRIINALRSINIVGLMCYFRDTVLLKGKLPVPLGIYTMQIAWCATWFTKHENHWSVTYFWAELCLFVYWAVWRNDLFEITLNLRTGVYSRYRVMPTGLL